MPDDKLVKRGELILLIDQREDPEEELKAMNQGKVGRPFTYTHSPNLDPSSVPGLPLSSPTANWLASPEDYPASQVASSPLTPQQPSRRIKKLVEERKLPDLRLKPEGAVTVAVDSTALKVGNQQ